MKTRGAWDKNRANPNRQTGAFTPCDPAAQTIAARTTNSDAPQIPGGGAGHARSILKPPAAVKASQQSSRFKRKSVTLAPDPHVYRFSNDSDDDNKDDEDGVESVDSTDKENDMSSQPQQPPQQRPALKLKLNKTNIQPDPTQTPNPQSGVRTPSIKLKLGGTPRASLDHAPKNKVEDAKGGTPGSSTKKRKRTHDGNKPDENPSRPQVRPPQIRKLTLKAAKLTPTPAPMIKLKSKGKIPKRPLGVGYDSELEDREADPVILEGFILRMQPGPDCDYVRDAIEKGTVGVHRAQGGADIRMRMLDTLGRRGILIVRGHQYATTLVDLPCIIEGMKSWDKKGWIKSIDISQMMIVLGRCTTDDEARNYPLPEDVNPKNYQYAHGITAPMKWVRKRRFARTKRARVDDIEAVERRVNALLEADRVAVSSRYQLLDHDPRLDADQYSSEYEEEDAEGEEEEEGGEEATDGYFALRKGQYGLNVETPMFTETPVEDIGQEDVDEFERMFEDEAPTNGDIRHAAATTLHLPEPGDSSFAVTSTSASPLATSGQTPTSGADQSSDEDEEDEEDEAERDEDEREGDENLQQVRDRIADMQQKITEQKELFNKTENLILKRKLAKKIKELEDDVRTMKRGAGLGGEDEDE